MSRRRTSASRDAGAEANATTSRRPSTRSAWMTFGAATAGSDPSRTRTSSAPSSRRTRLMRRSSGSLAMCADRSRSAVAAQCLDAADRMARLLGTQDEIDVRAGRPCFHVSHVGADRGVGDALADRGQLRAPHERRAPDVTDGVDREVEAPATAHAGPSRREPLLVAAVEARGGQGCEYVGCTDLLPVHRAERDLCVLERVGGRYRRGRTRGERRRRRRGRRRLVRARNPRDFRHGEDRERRHRGGRRDRRRSRLRISGFESPLTATVPGGGVTYVGGIAPCASSAAARAGSDDAAADGDGEAGAPFATTEAGGVTASAAGPRGLTSAGEGRATASARRWR